MKTQEQQMTSDVYSEENSQAVYRRMDDQKEMLPHQLSGDQNVQRDALMVDITNSSATKAIMTIMKTVVGAGALSLPFAISKLGYIFAIVVFVAVTAFSYFSTALLVAAKNLTKHSNFSTIFYYLHMKKPIKILASMFIFLKNVGICTAQLTIFGESIRKVLTDFITDKQVLQQWYTKEITIILFIAAIQLPLAAARKIERLKLFSFIGVFGMAFFVICLLIHFFTQMKKSGWIPSATISAYPQDWLKFSAVIPNVLLSLTFQANFFSIYKGMKDSNDHRIKSATLTALISSGCIYLVVCMCAYILYGSGMNPNFLLSIQKQKTSNILYYGMNLGFLVSVIFAFPIMFFSARNNFIAMVRHMMAYYYKIPIDYDQTVAQEKQYQDQQIDDQQKKKRRNAYLLYYGLTFLLYAIVITLAILVGNIQIIFNIIGAVCSTTICFLFPYYFYFTITQKHKKKKGFVYFYTKIAFFILIPYAIFSVVVRSL